MMKVKALTSYAFVNENKQNLTLIYGRVVDEKGNVMLNISAQRWSVMGFNIPFPVRSETWFEGFATDVMFKWLESNGWTYCGRTSLQNGKTYIPNNVKPVKKETKEELNAKIVELMKNGDRIKAILAYREHHPELLLYQAGYKVDEIYSNAKH